MPLICWKTCTKYASTARWRFLLSLLLVRELDDPFAMTKIASLIWRNSSRISGPSMSSSLRALSTLSASSSLPVKMSQRGDSGIKIRTAKAIKANMIWRAIGTRHDAEKLER